VDRRRGGHPGAPLGTGRSLNAAVPPARAGALDETLNSVITWIDPGDGAGHGPLGGLRVGLKDNIDTAGILTTCASAFFHDRVPEADAEVVERLRAAGAAITAKLNMAEFAVGVTSQNSAYGGCRNPWDPQRIPGGSSGGSGVAVAAGLVDAALGTDTGGSVRLPAAMCGVSGLRPTVGRISTAGVFPVSTVVDTVGPMARTVADLARLFAVLARSHQPARPAIGRLGIPTHFFTDGVDPGVTAVVAAAASDLEALGTDLVRVALPGVDTAQDAVYTLVYSELSELHRDRLRSEPDRFHPDTLARVRLGLSLTNDDRTRALRARASFQAALDDLFTEVDVILTPTIPIDVPPRGGGDVIAVARHLGRFTYPWSLHTGPTLALPVGFHPDSGMPVGAQLTAAAGQEDVLLTLGAAYQERTRWHRRRPPSSLEEIL
jgi:aspartyl-tRNA(Asn)/glutamyl-tRNA(Gln) amidotransferase subunit A